MVSHPNRSKRRPVATCTDRAEILGHARTEAEAVAILSAWAETNGVGPITSARQADVMIDRPRPGQWRFPRAWIPA